MVVNVRHNHPFLFTYLLPLITPPKGDIIMMVDNSGRYRLRVGDYRFLFTKKDNVLTIAKISPRGDAYKK